jgi:TRAP transporter TAXI family solute receptor
MLNRRHAAGACVLACLLGFAGVAGAAEDRSPAALRFTVGAAGGNWFIIGSGMAKIINEAYPEISVSVVPAGFVASLTKTASGESDIGVGFLTQAVDAKLGRGPFREPIANLRALVGGFSPTYMQFAVRADFPAESLDEVVKKELPISVAAPTPKMVAWSIVENMFGFFGKNLREMQSGPFSWQSVNYAQATQLYQDRRVDGMLYVLANPAAMINEARLSRPLKILPLSEELVDHMVDKWGFQRGVIKAGSYEGMVAKDVPTFYDGTGLFVPAEMSDSVAYRLTRALAENAEKVRQIHPSVSDFDPNIHWKVKDLHPGAARYYKEKGLM